MKGKLKSNQAITLVALVITIIIIIILSTIAINFAFGENGLITRAQQAAEMSVVSRILEQLEMAKGSAYIDGAGEIDPDHYFDILEEEGIIEDKETDVVDNGDGTYDVTTEGDRVFEVTLEPDGDLDIEYIGKNNEPRISQIKVTDKTENSVSIEVVTKNVDGGEYTYSYKKSGESSWIEAGKSSDNTYTFSGLENNTSYDIKVTVITGETTIEKTITVQLGEETPPLPEIPDNTITFGQAVWQGDGTAKVPISTTESEYTLQYQLNSTSGVWTTITSGESITGLIDGDTIYAKITDGENDSEIQQTIIEDNGAPTVNVKLGGTTSSSISVNVEATDKESGMADSITYTYYIKQSGESNYEAKATDISQDTYTFTGLQQGISYDVKVEVKSDNAGNTGVGYLAGQTTGSIPGGDGSLEDGTITVSEPEWADGKASITVSTDTEYNIEYQVGGTSEGSWITIVSGGTIPNLNYGDKVNIRLTDGVNHGEYVTVTIGDEIAPTVGVTLGTSTSSSISVNVAASDNESGMTSSLTYTYYIKESTEPDSSYTVPEDATDISANTYTFTGLKQNTSYDIKVEVRADMAGNMGTGTLLNQTTSTIPGGDSILEDGTLTIGEPKWSGGKASIIVGTNTQYQIEYQVNGTTEGSWISIDNNGTISNLNNGDKVNIRLTDGENAGGYVTKEIKDEVAPTVTVSPSGAPTSNSISVSASASDKESGMASSLTYTYYIKQNGTGDESYQAPSGATDIVQNTYTFTGLQQGTSYDVKVEVTGDVAGNTGTGTLLNQTTESIPGGSEGVEEGAITFGTPSWSSGQASITVRTNTSYKIEYKLSAPEEDTGWTEIASGNAINNLSHGATVYARLTDGTNHGEYATANITDSIAPTVTVTPQGTPTSNSLSVSTSATDNESGMASSLTYTYYIKQSAEADTAYVAKASNIAANTYIFSGLTQGTSYDVKVEVTGDVAGNTGSGTLLSQTTESIPGGETGVEDGSITFSTPSWSGGKASVIVSTNTSYDIEYQIGGIEGSWTSIENNGTIPNLDNGTTVYARLTDGVNHGEYASVTIQDNTPPTVSLSTSATYNSITVTVNASDGESGLATSDTYKYYINNESTPRNTSTSNSYTFPGLTEQTSYSIKVEVTNGAGKVGQSDTNVTTVKKPASNINEIKEAEYVNYVAKNGSTILCTVLYDINSPYGVEIISMQALESVEIGNGTGGPTNTKEYYNIALNSYNNAISTLNNKAASYNNTTYSTSARSVGSVPNNPSYDAAGMFTSSESYMSSHNNTFKDTDENYVTDWEQMKKLNIAALDFEYWLSSRYVYVYQNASDSTRNYIKFDVRYVMRKSSSTDLEYYLSRRVIGGVNAKGILSGDSTSYSIRPIFKLKDGIKITGGSGTESDPYTLGV